MAVTDVNALSREGRARAEGPDGGTRPWAQRRGRRRPLLPGRLDASSHEVRPAPQPGAGERAGAPGESQSPGGRPGRAHRSRRCRLRRAGATRAAAAAPARVPARPLAPRSAWRYPPRAPGTPAARRRPAGAGPEGPRAPAGARGGDRPGGGRGGTCGRAVGGGRQDAGAGGPRQAGGAGVGRRRRSEGAERAQSFPPGRVCVERTLRGRWKGPSCTRGNPARSPFTPGQMANRSHAFHVRM